MRHASLLDACWWADPSNYRTGVAGNHLSSCMGECAEVTDFWSLALDQNSCKHSGGSCCRSGSTRCHSMGDWQHAKLIITPVSTVVTEVTCRNGELSCSPEFRFDVHICDQCRLVPQQLQAHNTPCHKSISKSIRSSRWVSRWDKMCEASLECVTYDVVQRCYFISKIAPQKRALSLWFEL